MFHYYYELNFYFTLFTYLFIFCFVCLFLLFILYSNIIPSLPHITNFSTKYFILSKIYTDEGGIKIVIPCLVCPPVWETIHLQKKLVDYLLIQADKPYGITILVHLFS